MRGETTMILAVPIAFLVGLFILPVYHHVADWFDGVVMDWWCNRPRKLPKHQKVDR